jgi:hypothetical protein
MLLLVRIGQILLFVSIEIGVKYLLRLSQLLRSICFGRRRCCLVCLLCGASSWRQGRDVLVVPVLVEEGQIELPAYFLAHQLGKHRPHHLYAPPYVFELLFGQYIQLGSILPRNLPWLTAVPPTLFICLSVVESVCLCLYLCVCL